MAALGAEASEKGENRSERAKEDCISKDARRQTDSLGMMRLETTPTVTRRGVSVAAPICSIQPPMKASPCSPRKMTPLVSVENHVPNMAATYKAAMPAKPIHLPIKTCQRGIGFVAMAWIVPEAISPESASTEVKMVIITARRSTA